MKKPTEISDDLASTRSIANTAMDSIDEAIYVRGPKRELLYVNPAAERLTGWSAHEALKRPCFEVFGDAGAKCNVECPIDRANRLRETLSHSEGAIVDRDGHEKRVGVSISPIRENGEVVATVVALRDLTQLHELEKTNLKTLMKLETAHQELKQSESRFREFAELSSDWWWETDAEHRFSYMGGPNVVARQHLMGRRRDEIIDTSLDPESWEYFLKRLDEHATFRDFVYPQDAQDGTRRWVRISGNPIFDAAGDFLGYRGIGTDITASVEENQSLRVSAERDVLTGLLNRRAFDQALRSCSLDRRGGGAQFGLAFIDLDRFKAINDGRGHPTGDKVLTVQASRLVALVRDDDLVARLGGDEFAVLFRGLGDRETADSIAAKICLALSEPVPIPDAVPVEASASVGVAVFPIHGKDSEVLIEAADQAMYRAKKLGGNRFAIAERKDIAERPARAI